MPRIRRVGLVYAPVFETETGERFALPIKRGDETYAEVWPERQPAGTIPVGILRDEACGEWFDVP